MPSPSLTLLRTQSDARLTELARAGHERAFEAIVERYRRPLLRAARRVLPEGRAEDALQQALLSAWTALRRGDDVRELRPWLYRIVHHTSLNALRVSGYDYDELHEALQIADAGADELERRAVVRQTLASLAALPERQREALLRTAVSGDSQEEVARDLGVSNNALRQLVHRARVSMRTAATALTPLPLVTAAAAGAPRGGPLVERIAELAAGSGASVTLAKAGTVVVLAGSAISGPAVVDRVADRPPHGPAAAAAATVSPPQPKRARPTAAATQPEPALAAPVLASRPVRSGRPAHPQPRSKRRARGDARREDRSGSDDDRAAAEPEEQEDRSGPDRGGSGGEDSHDAEDHSGSGSGASGPGSDDLADEPEEEHEDRSGPGPGVAPIPSVTATPEPVEIDEDSHSGSDSSGPGGGSDDDPE
jgi:RNA polymerase sigma factor (sigma-70 family)